MSIFKSTFDKAVDDIAVPTLSKYGISLVKVDPKLYKGQSEYTAVDIEFDRSYLAVYIGPVESQESVYEETQPMYWVLMAIAPQVQFIEKQITLFHGIRRELTRQIRLLTTYCDDMLRGDFSRWSEVKKTMKQFASPIEQNEYIEWLSTLRRDARDAFEAGNYVFADRAYTALMLNGIDFSIEEKRIWKITKQRLAKLQRL